MSSALMSNERATQIPSAETVDMKLEVVVIPVLDVDRAKRFYGSLGWRLDADFTNGADWRVVQMTPPGSPCSIHFGKGLTTAVPGSIKNIYLVVSDIEAARGELAGRGIDVSPAFHFTALGGPRASGPEPSGRSYGTFATFSDPDGNSWLLQEIKTRLPGRGTNPDVESLTELLREAEEHHGEYEPTAPKHHWSDWYAAYIVARERGRAPEDAVKDATLHMERIRPPMKTDVVPGAVLPDYELPDHRGKHRTLSELQQGDPLVLVLSRGSFCPKDRRQHEGLLQLHREMQVGYCRLVTLSTDNLLDTNEFRAGVGALWTFLADPGRRVQKDLDIAEYTDPQHNPMIPHTLVLEPGLRVYKIYNGYWFFGRPTVEELRLDLRAVLQRCRPDWDISSAEQRSRWSKGEKASFFPYGKTQAQMLAEQD